MNAVEIEQALSDLAAQAFDGAEFPFQFLAAFGNKTTTIARLRKGESNASDVPGGVLQRNHIHIAVAEPGQVGQALTALKASAKTAQTKAKFVLATDGTTLEAEELTTGDAIACEFGQFPDHFGFFLPLAGISTIREIKDNPIDVRATGRLNKLYVELLRENPDWATVVRRPDMNHFMARLIFCFFAEDTDIFPGATMFTATVDQMSERDGANVHEVLGTIFRAMNTKTEDRATAGIPRWAIEFPYVNGGLFSGSTDVPKFTRTARSYLYQAGQLDWREINPDIFGSMIQAVADDEERGALGMHYTSVPNILKVLNPLFLDDLRAQLEAAGDNKIKLLNLRKRMARIRVFDPACGSGNFLVIAYKQMREIEAEINHRRGEVNLPSEIPINNFRGIELRDFPAEIARLALIIAEFQCDVLYRGQKEALKGVLPLDSQNWITCGNALRLDWLAICPPTGTGVKLVGDDLFNTPLDQSEIDFENEGGETYICGNPPYLGAKKKSAEQSSDMIAVGLGKAQLLDYVCAFIVKGLEYMEHADCEMALVSTSSICQGEQVALLWPMIYENSSVKFAYRPFKWANSATQNAGVYCTILGLARSKVRSKKLFSDSAVIECESLSPYLVPGPEVICEPTPVSVSRLRQMVMGSNPVDGKRLIFEDGEYRAIVSDEPELARFFKKYGGTDELVNGNDRWCLWVEDDDVDEAKSYPTIVNIIERCEEYRKGAGRDARKAAKRPHAFCYSTFKSEAGMQVGLTIGNGLSYVPVRPRSTNFVSSHTAYMIYGWAPIELSLIASKMMLVWTEAIGGRLGNGSRFSNTIVYNTFPVPELTDQNRLDLTRCAEEIVLSRETHFPMSIAELYGTKDGESLMPEDLRRAHDKNDEVLERIYIGRKFKNDTERLEKLFDLYTKMTAGQTKPKKGKRK